MAAQTIVGLLEGLQGPYVCKCPSSHLDVSPQPSEALGDGGGTLVPLLLQDTLPGRTHGEREWLRPVSEEAKELAEPHTYS